MARPGYMEAKNAQKKAKTALADARIKLAVIQANEDGLFTRTDWLQDAFQKVKDAQDTLERTTAEFAVFARPVRPKRKPCDSAVLHVLLSLPLDEIVRINQRCERDAITRTELIRRSIRAYLVV